MSFCAAGENDPLPTSHTLTHLLFFLFLFSPPQGFSPERLPASCCHSAPDFHISSPAKSFFKKAAAALFGGKRDKVKYYETLSECCISLLLCLSPPTPQKASLITFILTLEISLISALHILRTGCLHAQAKHLNNRDA